MSSIRFDVGEHLDFLASFFEALQTAGFTSEDIKRLGEDPKLLLRVLEIVRADLDSPDAETPDGRMLDWHPADVPAFLRRAAYDEPKAKKKPKFR